MRGFAVHLETPGLGEQPRSVARIVNEGLQDLITVNSLAYERDPKLPGIYEAGVVYRREAPGHEQFCDVHAVLNRGYGDCEDLSAAVVSWRRVRLGEFARPRVTWKRMSAGRWLFHITVLRGDGKTVEDPSALLGMRDEPGDWRLRGALWIYELKPGRRGVVPRPVPIHPQG